MIYLEKDGKISSYKIELDQEKLYKVKEEIINNCSHIVHVKKTISCFESSDLSTQRKEDPLKIRNYKEEESCLNEYFYDVEYNFYEYPPIIEKINEIMNTKDDKVIYKFFEIISSMCISKKDWKKNLKYCSYFGSDILNKNQKPVGYYFDDIVNCIELVPVNDISKTEFDNMRKYIDNNKINKKTSLIKVSK